MGKCILHLDGKFMLWSSMTDAPDTPLLPEALFKQFWYAEYGRSGWLDYEERMAEAKERGCSFHNYTVNEVLSNNRAGAKEKKLSKKKIIKYYTCESPEDFKSWSERRDHAFRNHVKKFGPKK